ncbi:MAG TPA: hypothetical protein VJ772_06855 [Nitrososphaeraceae archaeon]|jgi:hypothetical protein|nr:hypothetical protein [Nitrososphaeraceae archaeon]
MSNDTIGRYLVRLGEMIIDGDNFVDKYKIGDDIGLVDRIQTDHIVEILLKEGYIRNNKEHSKISLTDEGHRRLDKK